MNPILELSLVDLVEAVRSRRLSPVELMDAVLERVEQTHDDLNAVVATYDREQLLSLARAAETRVMRGEARPLEGIPAGIKDLEDSAGLVTTHGSLVHSDQPAVEDSLQVGRLRAAGVIPIGKTNTPEHGYTAITKNLVYGVTRSPWNLQQTPGGSSGGSAAAVAACALPIATASDGGGSIRIPASFTGCFGFKPTFGRIPRGKFEHWPYRDTSCWGPLTKTVEDAALLLDPLVGPDPYDPKSLPHPGISYLEALRGELPSGLRIGYSPDLGYAVVQSDVAEAVYDAARALEGLGHKLEEFEGGPPMLGDDWGRLNAFENAATRHALLPGNESEFGRSYLVGLKTGWKMTPEKFGELAKQRMKLNDWCAETFSRYDVIVTPTVPYDPPAAKGPFPSETDGRPQIPVGVAAFTVPFNLSWHPAASVRVGLSRAGLPIGMQIVGPRHRDELVLQLARAFERERPWHPNWPTTW